MKFEFVVFEKNRKMLKAQMSLEMIIGLLILVIVAAVVIRTFLSSMGTMEKLQTLRESTEYKEFSLKCTDFCRGYSLTGNPGHMVKFCTFRLFPAGTKNKIGKPGEIDVITPESDIGTALLYPWSVCEDAIFCFHLFDCSEYATITMEDCRKILCEYYSEIYKDPMTGAIDYAGLDEKIRSIYQGKAKNPYGSCNLDRNNWFIRYFIDPVTGSICGR